VGQHELAVNGVGGLVGVRNRVDGTAEVREVEDLGLPVRAGHQHAGQVRREVVLAFEGLLDQVALRHKVDLGSGDPVDRRVLPQSGIERIRVVHGVWGEEVEIVG
jgi:hypothetical protein